jgi:hypothetical protein
MMVLNECYASVGRRVLIQARALQERMAVRLGVTLTVLKPNARSALGVRSKPWER